MGKNGVLSSTDWQNANSTIPRIAGLESPEIPQREANKCQIAVKWNRRKSIQNRHLSCILSMLKSDLGIARFESCYSEMPDSRFRIADSAPLRWGRFVIFPVLCLLAFGDTELKS